MATALVAMPAALAAQQFAFVPYHTTDIYAVGERVGWHVMAVAGQTAAPGRYTYVVKRDGLTPVDSGSFRIPSTSATIETSLDRPGMVLVEVHPPADVTGFRGASKSEVGRVLLGAAVAPTKIRPSESRPADFDQFWAAKVRQLAAIPMDAKLARGESDTPEVDYFTIWMNNIQGAHVYGQLARPSKAGKYPALLILQ